MDGGAQSLVIDDGRPRPRTQIEVGDGGQQAFLDMGWDDPKIGLDYDGDYHFSDRPRYVRDISRDDLIRRQRWLDIKVVKEHSRAYILHRVRQAWAERG